MIPCARTARWNEPSSLLYALRVLAFGIIIAAIVDKNLA